MKSWLKTPVEKFGESIVKTLKFVRLQRSLSEIRLSGQKRRTSSPVCSSFTLFLFLTIILLLSPRLPLYGQIIYPFEKPVLIHYPVESLRDLRHRKIVLLIEGRKTGLRSVSIFLKKDVDVYFKEFPMSYKEGVWEFFLDHRFLDSYELEYFFTAEFSDYGILALPEESPEKSPFKLKIRDK